MPIEIGSPSILLTSKTKAVILNKPNTITRSNLHWELGDKTVCPSEETTQLDIIRIELKENQLNVEARISLARRTLYSLINTGVYGSNGLNPKVSFLNIPVLCLTSLALRTRNFTTHQNSFRHSQQISYEKPEEFSIVSKQNSQRSHSSTNW